MNADSKTIMPIQLIEENGGKLFAVHVSGKLVKEDYAHFVPEFERLVSEHGKLNVLFDMAAFHGWEVAVAWEDTKFGIHHFKDIERIAWSAKRSGRRACPCSANPSPKPPSAISNTPT